MNRPQPGERKRPGDFCGGVLKTRSRSAGIVNMLEWIEELLSNKKVVTVAV